MIIFTKEILDLEEAFRLVILHYSSEKIALDMVTSVLHEARQGCGTDVEMMFELVDRYGDDIVRPVSSDEIDIFGLDAAPHYISLL